MDDFHHIHGEVHEDELPEPKSKLKKAIIALMGIFLVLLMLSFTIVTFPISDIIRGQLESNPIDENKIVLDDFTIFFEENTQNQLLDIYNNEQKVEFSVCLSGTKENQDYKINNLYLPIQQAEFNHVSFEPCSEETLIMLHSHPYKSCLASDTDLNTLKQNKATNPDILMVVMCEPGRFSVYN